ncbi:peptidylprolyl isomerase, partial [Kiritimatiellaeota bacterium B1221]|nr:peptidylprolyl isomerase [Kiritimatiellaeota bacterium B1221]
AACGLVSPWIDNPVLLGHGVGMKQLLLTLPLFLFSLVFAADGGNALLEIKTFISEQEKEEGIDKSKENWRTGLPKFPDASFGEGGHYEWVIETSEGTMTAELNHAAAPEHVRNILYLSSLGFYDGLNFHRIIPGFMAQGGCPLGKGYGSPGYSVNLEVDRNVLHEGPGILSMARSRNPNSAGSQFFITFGSTPQLDGQYSVFGKVTEGLDVLKKLEAAGNPNPRTNGVPPLKNITIDKTTVRWVEDEKEHS